jgi:hypothetical protein
MDTAQKKTYMRTWRFYAFSFIFFLCGLPLYANAATLSLMSSSQAVNVGSIFTVSANVSSPSDALNAVSGTITFPTDLLEVVSVSKSTAVISLWVQEPAFSNSDGSINFSGVVPNPGWSGAQGKVLTIQFRSKRAGTATIGFSSASVLANDGNGTNILTSTQPASVTSANKAPPPPEQAPPPAAA